MKKHLAIAILSILCTIGYGQEAIVLNKIDKIVKNKKVSIGIAIHDFTTNTTFSIKGNDKFPMQSVFKLPIGIVALDKVDNKELSLTELIDVPKNKLHPNTWSPIREKHPNGTSLTLLELLNYTIAESDNNGCDLLIEMLNGTESINKYFKDANIENINIEVNEFDLNWNSMYRNWITPMGAIDLLKKIHKKELLSLDMHNTLWTIMTNSSTGSFRKKIPKSVIVGNKTGSSGYKDGVSIATNDIGIMILPDGRAIAFAIFITDSYEISEVNYEIISDIAKVLFLEYS